MKKLLPLKCEKCGLGGFAIPPASLEIEKRLANLKKDCGTCSCH